MMQKPFYQSALNRLRVRLERGDNLHEIALASESLLSQAKEHEPEIPDQIAERLLGQT